MVEMPVVVSFGAEPPHPRPLSPKGARGEFIPCPRPPGGEAWTVPGVFSSRGGQGAPRSAGCGGEGVAAAKQVTPVTKCRFP